jgi:NAD-dependent deacetylase
MNLEPSMSSGLFDENRIGSAGELVPLWVGEMLGQSLAVDRHSPRL